MPDENVTSVVDWLDLTMQEFVSKTPELLEQECRKVLLPIYRDMYREQYREQLWEQYREWCRKQGPAAMKRELLEDMDIETEIERIFNEEMPKHDDHIKAEVDKLAAKVGAKHNNGWAENVLSAFGMIWHWLKVKEP